MDNGNIEILDELNDLLAENNMECFYQFIYSQSPNGFVFSLEEIALTGQSFIMFNSNESLPEVIQQKYEMSDGDLSYTFKEAIIRTIKHNIQIHIKNLEIVQDLLKEI